LRVNNSKVKYPQDKTAKGPTTKTIGHLKLLFKFGCLIRKIMTAKATTIKPNNYIIDKARNYFNVLKKYNLNKEKDFTAQAISLHFLETNSGLPIEKMALKILDAERLNQFGLDPNIELSLSATMMRFMLNVINLIMKLADKKKIAPGSFIDRMIISVKKLRIILSFEYSKKTKGRCQRITDLLRGTAKKFGSSVIKRKGLKDDYRLDSFVKFMETDGEPTPRLYEDMKSDCNKKKGFLTRTRCSRLVKARQNFDRYVNKHCEPRRNKTLIGGKKGIKHKAKTLKKIQTGGDADDALIYLSVGAIIIVCFVMGSNRIDIGLYFALHHKSNRALKVKTCCEDDIALNAGDCLHYPTVLRLIRNYLLSVTESRKEPSSNAYQVL
jgi:hypothetical protein